MQLDNRVTFATPEGVSLELVLAGLGSRFLARLLDTVIQVAIIIALAVGVGVSGSPGWLQAIAIVLIFLVVFAYDVIFETLNNGRTIGKLAAGIRVVGRNGEPVRFLASAVRNIVRIVDFLPIFYLIGTVSIVATEHDQRLGDLAAGTHRDPRSLPRPRAHAGADHRDARRGRDLGRVRGQRQRAPSGAALSRPPARAALGRAFLLRARARRTGSAPKVAGIPPNSHPEYVLEGIVVAKQGRT